LPSVPPRIYFPNHEPYLHFTSVFVKCIPQSDVEASKAQEQGLELR
jgi:hypothetical protein